MSTLRPALAGRSFLLAALAAELADELVDGTQGAAVPLIRHSLGLSYEQVGLLFSVPLILGGLLELPLGILAGRGSTRRRAVLAGGLVFIASLAGAAAAGSFGWLLAAFVVFFPASGAFVSLTQAELMDADPARRAQHMARWTLAGSLGAVAGPLLLSAVIAAGGSWRTAYLALAAVAAIAWLALARTTPHPANAAARGAILTGATSAEGGAVRPGRSEPKGRAAVWTDERGDEGAGARREDGGLQRPGGEGGPEKTASRGQKRARVREAAGVLRASGGLRWLLLLQVADLLLDVLTGFLALYLVDVAHASPAQAALAVAVRLGAGLAGDVLTVHLLERTRDLPVLRAAAAAAAVLYPAFLLVPGLGAKLAVLAALSVATASWYPVMQARWYRSLPEHSDVAVSLESAATLAGGLGPAAVGGLAGLVGLGWALAGLGAVPLVILAALARPASERRPGSPHHGSGDR
ncbi:MAG: MFS transporter [Gemmatimonadota bacterium]